MSSQVRQHAGQGAEAAALLIGERLCFNPQAFPTRSSLSRRALVRHPLAQQLADA